VRTMKINMRKFGLKPHIIPSFIEPHGVTFNQVLTVGELVPVRENVFAAAILNNEPKSLGIIEKLDRSRLAHCTETRG
jgi:hypothetical protein